MTEKNTAMTQKTIVVVEDNDLNSKLIAAVLSKAGYNVVTCGDAESGLQLVRAHCPDLILMDIQLPGMDGLSAARQLKADPHTQNIPIIALSAHAMGDHQEMAVSAGCCGYITKPFSTRTLSKDIERYL
jgi:two-component system, cell cycle response regulator DivK